MDINSLMRQAQEMQKKMQKSQEELAARIYQGQSGGGMVNIDIAGDGTAKKLNIDESLLVKEEKEILEDLIIAAFNSAKKKADEDNSSLLKDATNGMSLPPGFKL
jgi:DNA-binding YbaB/EbfC family protein